MFYTRTKISML